MYPSVCGDVRRRACVHTCHVDVRTLNRPLSPVYMIQPVVRRLYNPFDNRLYPVNGVLVLPVVTALLICSV